MIEGLATRSFRVIPLWTTYPGTCMHGAMILQNSAVLCLAVLQLSGALSSRFALPSGPRLRRGN